MRIIEVIESKRWRNLVTGATASIYGACPYYSSKHAHDWVMETVGYTWRLDNGTIGLGRMPAKTHVEAVEIMHRYNDRFTV